MDLQSAKTKAQECIDMLVKTTDDIFDDGRDNDNVAQNSRFVSQTSIINKAHSTLASIEIDGMDSEEFGDAWYKAWDGSKNTHLPEEKHNHALRYANWILSL